MLRKPCALNASRLAFHLLQRQRNAQDRVVAREAAVFAVVDALVGKVKRREQADDLAEALLRHAVCERRPMCSSNSPPAGEIKCAKSASDNFVFAMLSRTAWMPADCERFTSDSSGNELNSATKLTTPR